MTSTIEPPDTTQTETKNQTEPTLSPTLSLVPGNIQTINPATGETLATYPLPSQTAIEAMVSDSHSAFQTFQHTSLKQRAALLLRIAHKIEEHGDALARAISEEMGKPIPVAYDSDITIAVASLRYMAKAGPKHLSPKHNNALTSLLLGRRHQTLRMPKGVVAIVSPWNYPLAIPTSGIASALMGGNAIILKPSEITPHVGKLLVEQIQLALEEFKLPTETVQCVLGHGQTGKALLEQDIQHVLFTGSSSTGQAIQKQVSGRGISTNIELGGNCPMVVLPETVTTAEQQQTIARHAVWGRCYNSGQSCAAVKRLILPDVYAEPVIHAIQKQLEELVIGNPLTNPVHLGPLTSKQQRDRLHSQVVDAIAQGGKLVTGGFLPGAPMDVGAYYPPTLITHLPPSASILNDELFGPVLLVQTYKNLDEAAELANNTPYGLTASVFSGSNSLSQSQAQAFAKKLHAGIVSINDVALVHYGFQHVPWHGLKQSGPGVSHSLGALDDCTQFKTIATNHVANWPGQSTPPWLFSKEPYPTKASLFSKAMLNLLAKNPVKALFQWSLLKGLWQRRPSKQL